jgi:peptidoglycan/xylan/chitin deacetylase (PgdA/CDA1 family)
MCSGLHFGSGYMRAILTFHSIDDSGSVVSCSPKIFARLMAVLAEKEIPVCDLETLLKPETRGGVAITFDDGMRSVYRFALPVISDFGATAHVFIATGAVGENSTWPRQPADIPSFEMLGWDEIEKLHNAGIAIESHTHTHPDMRTLTREQMEDECGAADSMIEKYLGRRPAYFAYPFGYHGKQARLFAGSHYQGAVTTELRMLGAHEDVAAIPRIDSYYLQSEATINYIDSLPVKGYLVARNILRNWRGSQCAAGCD